MRAFEDLLDMAIAELEAADSTDSKCIEALVRDAMALVETSEAMRTVERDIVASTDALLHARSDFMDTGKVTAAQAHAVELIEHLRLLMGAAEPTEHARVLGLD